MALRPEISVTAALATAALVYGIYSNATPTIADIRVGAPHDPDISSSERTASWLAAGVVGGVSLVAKDPTIFVFGGAMIIAMAWLHRHANMVDPATGTATGPDMSLQQVPDGLESAA